MRFKDAEQALAFLHDCAHRPPAPLELGDVMDAYTIVKAQLQGTVLRVQGPSNVVYAPLEPPVDDLAYAAKSDVRAILIERARAQHVTTWAESLKPAFTALVWLVVSALMLALLHYLKWNA